TAKPTCPPQRRTNLSLTIEDAVPWLQINSANSAGCHRLLKEGVAVLVSDAAEVAELLAG
ncbi:hypothetical protein AB0O54_21140, partial [Pseudarthrobacter oxydans]